MLIMSETANYELRPKTAVLTGRWNRYGAQLNFKKTPLTPYQCIQIEIRICTNELFSVAINRNSKSVSVIKSPECFEERKSQRKWRNKAISKQISWLIRHRLKEKERTRAQF